MLTSTLFKAKIVRFHGSFEPVEFDYYYAECPKRSWAARWAVEDYIREHEDLTERLIPTKFVATVIVEDSGGNKSNHEIVAQASYTCYEQGPSNE